ncbi:Friend leukemia integration 1 transcription factor, partial [Desmophyllum pertusum]
LPSKQFKTTKIFEFILDMLSEPRYSSIISWEGTNGQFRFIEPDRVASLWGERNGRVNMTYQKFSRALRYYYHKNVLVKFVDGNTHTGSTSESLRSSTDIKDNISRHKRVDCSWQPRARDSRHW